MAQSSEWAALGLWVFVCIQLSAKPRIRGKRTDPVSKPSLERDV